jgi:D-3-phosphoglycerate dehydrogenase / 2-oxoglutarate reductase
MPRFKVVHVDPLGRRMDIENEVFEPADVELVAQRCTSDEEVIALAHDAEALLCTVYPITGDLLTKCNRLRVIVRYGVGVDNVDLDAATSHGVMVCNVPDYCIDEVANHTMALLLALNRRIVQLNSAIRSGEKVSLSPLGPLRGETLGLLGLGRLAQAVASRARAFGLRIIAYDPYVASGTVGDVELLSLPEVLSRSDYLSVHVPLTSETRGLIGSGELALMKPTAYIVSTARGGVISESALEAALAAGLIAGAGLDVWEREPVAVDNPLLASSQVIGTPHIAYFSNTSAVALRRRVAEITLEALQGKVPSSLVNREVVDR